MTPEYTNSAIHRMLAAQSDRERWTTRLGVIGAFAAIVFAFMLAGAVDLQVEQATAPEKHDHYQRLAAAAELERGLRKCPPAGDGYTDIIALVVRYESDLKPVTVERCMRFAERSNYLPRRQP